MEHEMTLHGKVVGIGIEHKDGSKDFKWLDKPIHNRIVSSGLDYLMTYNGSNRDLYNAQGAIHYHRWRRMVESESSTDPYNGCLQFLAVGTNGDSTSFEDTSLKNQVGGYSETVPYGWSPYNGTNIDPDTLTLKLRITLSSVPMENSVTIREVGWFGKYYNQNVYPMFSRVVLDDPVDLEINEKLIVCYELHINEYENDHEISSIFSGLLDYEGNALRAFAKRPIYGQYFEKTGWINGNYYGNGVSDKLLQIPYSIKTNGLGHVWNASYNCSYNTRFLSMGPVLKNNYYYYSNTIIIPKNVNYIEPKSSSTGLIDYNDYEYDSNNCILTVHDYIPGTFTRERDITILPAFPNMQEQQYRDIYSLIYEGIIIKFGYYDENKQWIAKPWRKEFGKTYKFTFRYKFSTVDTQ